MARLRLGGLLLTLSGYWIIMGMWYAIDRRLARPRVRRYHRLVEAAVGQRVPPLAFPFSHFQKALRRGMTLADADAKIPAPDRTERIAGHGGQSVQAYHFPFSRVRPGVLYVVFDRNGRLIRVQHENLRYDL